MTDISADELRRYTRPTLWNQILVGDLLWLPWGLFALAFIGTWAWLLS